MAKIGRPKGRRRLQPISVICCRMEEYATNNGYDSSHVSHSLKTLIEIYLKVGIKRPTPPRKKTTIKEVCKHIWCYLDFQGVKPESFVDLFIEYCEIKNNYRGARDELNQFNQTHGQKRQKDPLDANTSSELQSRETAG